MQCQAKIRNAKGQFIYTNGAGRYKRKIVKGKNVLYHRYIWEKYNGVIPEGFIVHHINSNKLDNRIENLKLITVQEHNKLHHTGRIPWNKELKCENISNSKKGHLVSQKQIVKFKDTLKNKFIGSMRLIYWLRKIGLSFKEISEKLDLTFGCVKARYLKYEADYLNEDRIL